MPKIIELTDNNFDTEISNASVPVLVDFFAPWCGHCRVQDPILDEFAEELGSKAIVAKINVDNSNKKAAEFGISGIPYLMLFKNGKLVKQEAGLHQKSDLSKMVKDFL